MNDEKYKTHTRKKMEESYVRTIKKKFELYTQTTGAISLHSENTNCLVKDKIMNLKV